MNAGTAEPAGTASKPMTPACLAADGQKANMSASADPLEGLSPAPAQALLAEHGSNELAAARRHGWLRSLLDVLREPMSLLVVGCAVLYFVLGEWREAVALSASVLVVMGIALVQEQRTEQALLALRTLASPRALVLRDGDQSAGVGRSRAARSAC
jgi:Ca2+-transporting ATPase